MKGLICSVYRDASGCDCTNHGVTSKAHTVILVGTGIPELFAPDDCKPALRLVSRIIAGKPYLHAVPVAAQGTGIGEYMFGGNFIHTSDGRFPGRYPIPVHDRTEKIDMGGN